jgi:hypothetical protein
MSTKKLALALALIALTNIYPVLCQGEEEEGAGEGEGEGEGGVVPSSSAGLVVHVQASVNILAHNIAVVSFPPGISIIALNHMTSLGAAVVVTGSSAKITFPSHITLVSHHSISSSIGFSGKLTMVRFTSTSVSNSIGVSIEGTSAVCPTIGSTIMLIPVTPIKASVSFGKITLVGPTTSISATKKTKVSSAKITKINLGG